MKKNILLVILLVMLLLCTAVVLPLVALAEGQASEDVAYTATVVSMIALVFALCIAGVLIWLYKTGRITATNLETIGGIVGQVTDFIKPGSNISLFAYYALQAVHAVEQLVKNGKLEKEDATRKEAAAALVKEYAALDGVELNEAELKAVDTLIEAQVGQLQ